MNMALNLRSYVCKIGWQRALFVFLMFVWIMSLPFKNAVYHISHGLVVLYFLAYLLITKNYKPLIENLKKVKFLTVSFTILFLVMVVANLLNPEFLTKKSWHITFMFAIRYGLMFVILGYFYTLEFFSKKEIVTAVFASFFLLSFTGIVQILYDSSVMFDVSKGITGSLDNRNAIGLIMGFAVSSSIVLFNYNKKLSLVFMLYFMFFMFFSFSRSAWVASFVSGLCFFVLNFSSFEKSDKKISVILVIALASSLAVLFFNSDALHARLDMLLEGNSSNRYLIWSYSWEQFLKNPIFGYGIDTFKNLPNSVVRINGNFNSTHNMVLEILLYTGIFGFLAASFAIFLALKELSKNLSLFPIGVHFLVVSQFDYGAYVSKEMLSYLTLLVFLAFADKFREKK